MGYRKTADDVIRRTRRSLVLENSPFRPFWLASMFVTPASLLYRLRRPEENLAWHRFVELYSPLLFHWAKQLGYQESDGADLVQDVFVILWRKMPEFEYDPTKSFHAWLKTLFINRYRSLQRNRDLRHTSLAEQESMEELQDTAIDPEDSRIPHSGRRFV